MKDHIFGFSRAELKKLTQPAFTCSKLTIETLEQVVKYVQSVSIVNSEQANAGWEYNQCVNNPTIHVFSGPYFFE